MKLSFVVQALFGLTALASDSFTGEVIVNADDATGQITYLLYDPNAGVASADNYWWKILTQSFFDMDTGYRWLRVTHTL